MIKKVIAIIMIAVSSLTILRVGYLFYKNYLSGQTQTPEMKEITNLKNAVPVSLSGFSINRFDDKTDQFIVIFSSPSASLEVSFDNWHKN